MGWLKIFKSRIAGRVPSVNQLDLDSVGINSADGKMFIKKRTGQGVESIVEISFGSGTGSETPPPQITEILQGLVNGSNPIFTTSVPYQSGSISVFLNGLKETNFSEISSTMISLSSTPLNVGFIDRIEAIYSPL